MYSLKVEKNKKTLKKNKKKDMIKIEIYVIVTVLYKIHNIKM